MRSILTGLLCVFFILFCILSCKPRETAQNIVTDLGDVKTERWAYDCFLVINNNHFVRFELSKDPLSDELTVRNGKEKIAISDYTISDDSISFVMPVFYSRIDAKISGSKLEGEWIKYPGTDKDYSMKFRGFSRHQKVIIPKKYSDYDLEADALDVEQELTSVSGKWSVTFSPGSEDEYPAIGEFQQDGNDLTGTFLTETGDYRFLHGKIYGNQFYLSTFDGSHAFLFEAEVLRDESIAGEFYSGTHWVEDFEATFDPDVELGNAYELTYLKEGHDKFDFDFIDIETRNNVRLNDSRFENKVVLLQIFGSWCPNCMDESVLYADLYRDYHSKGLEIVGVAFERAETLDQKTKGLLVKYKKHFGLEYPILFGGKANKKLAGEKFPMLNHVMSFPTTIILNKNREVVDIHTGFAGPATAGYDDFVTDLKSKIEKLLAE